MLRDRSACARTSGKSGRSGAQRHEVAGAANEPATRSAYYCSDARPVPRRCGTTQNLSKAGSRRRNLATSLHKELWNSERLGFAKMKHAPKPYVEVPFGECQSTIRGMPKCHSGERVASRFYWHRLRLQHRFLNPNAKCHSGNDAPPPS